jgi:hypothetical protein
MIGACNAFRRDDFARKRPEAPLHPVAHDRSADLLGHGEADAHRGVRILAIADEQDEAGSCRALAGVGRDEVGALGDRC